jgi:hypothetical protein
MPKVKQGTYQICQNCLGRISGDMVKVEKGRKNLGFYHPGCADRKFGKDQKRSFLKRLFNRKRCLTK